MHLSHCKAWTSSDTILPQSQHDGTDADSGAFWDPPEVFTPEVEGFGDACALPLPELFLAVCGLVVIGCLLPLTMLMTVTILGSDS